LERRLAEHRSNRSIFSAKYGVHHLVWCQEFSSPIYAIAMEKRIKKMPRKVKEALVSSMNPYWIFLGEE